MLLSDGASTKGRNPIAAAQEAKRAKIPVYTVALGTPDGTITVPRPGGPGARGGIQTGDVIVSINGRRVDDPSDVSAGIQGQAPGDVVTVQVQRDGQPVTLDVELGKRPRQGP